TSKLNDVMLPIIQSYPPPATKGKYIKIKYVTQINGRSPMFAFFCNLPQYVKDPYKRFIENKLRENFGFEGVPIDVFFRQKYPSYLTLVNFARWPDPDGSGL